MRNSEFRQLGIEKSECHQLILETTDCEDIFKKSDLLIKFLQILLTGSAKISNLVNSM